MAKFTDNTAAINAAVNDAIEKALVQIGEQAVGYAVQHITQQQAVDTGLLRNSITYALGGQPAAKPSYSADSGSGTGQYSGTAPADSGGQRSVYIGTNVEYAPYIEYGRYAKTPSWRTGPRPFIAPSVLDHQDEYQNIIATEIIESLEPFKNK